MDEIVKSSPTGKGMVLLYSNGIMHQTYEKGTEISLVDSQKEMEIYRKEYITGHPRPILVELNNIKSVSKESRGIYSSMSTREVCSAAALLVGNPVSRILGNFYIGINKTAMPVRMFTDKKEALSWLGTFLNGG